MLPFAGYTRVSRVGDREDRLTSHDDQRDRIRAFAGSRLEVAFLDEESDVSGSVVERPILEQALVGIESGLYAGIIVADIDRLFRAQIVEALHVVERVENAGGQVIACAQNFDATTAEGEHVRNMWLSQARLQWRRYADGFARSKARAVEAGIWPCPEVPFGYRCRRRKDGGDGILKPDRRQARKVVRAFEARAGGASWREVGKIVGRSPSGAARLIENPVYLGEIRYSGAVNRVAHEPLVDRALWEAAQIAHPRPNGSGKAPPSLLQGIVRCAACSCAMTPDGVRGHRYYRCRPHTRVEGACDAPAMVSQPALDEYVEELVLPFIKGLEVFGRARGRSLDEAQKALDKAERELEHYQRAQEVSGLGVETFAAGMRERFDKVERARRVLGEARGSADAIPEAGTLGKRWPDLTVEQRRHVLRRSLGAVFVRKGRGVSPDRVKVLAAGFAPGDLPGHHGTRRAVGRVFDWVDDLPGEVRGPVPQDVAEPGGGAGT